MLLLGVEGLVIAALISLGRSSVDPGSAMTSHYAIGAIFFWIATLTIALFAARTSWEEGSTTARAVTGMATAGAVLVLAWGYATANATGYREAYQRSQNLQMALASLYSDQKISRPVSQFLYPPDDGRIERQITELKDLRLGPFSPGMDAARAELVDRFAGQVPTVLAEGFHDGGNCQQTVGWAWERSRPDVPIMIDIWHRGEVIGTATANWFRTDLLNSGIGNGQHGFVFQLPAIAAGTGQEITVTFSGTTTPIGGSPKVVTCR